MDAPTSGENQVKQHNYELQVQWTGNTGEGTKTYRSYNRNYTITAAAKPEILGSSDPSFRGDPSRYNPEDLLVASLSACHMLSYLHLCAVNHITVLDYRDSALGLMEENANGSAQFTHVTLRPNVKISPGDDQAKAHSLHADAHHLCFIARSVNFPVEVAPTITPSSTD
jgi:organic hydroperoxide reductase OsmC/OhrA